MEVKHKQLWLKIWIDIVSTYMQLFLFKYSKDCCNNTINQRSRLVCLGFWCKS